MQFFIRMIPPTVTHQDKKIRAFMRGGNPCAVLHDSERLKAVKQKFHAYLAPHRPPQPLTGPVRLVVKWIFPADGHPTGEWKTTKPDTDNLQKALKDTMTRLHYWQDDAQVASEIVEKFWGNPCGIFISVTSLSVPRGSDNIRKYCHIAAGRLADLLQAADGSPAYVVISADFAAELRTMLEAAANENQ